MLQLPKSIDPKGRELTTGRAARALFNEIATPAGRVVDELFMGTLSRPPLPAERQLALSAFEKNRVTGGICER